MPRAKKRAKTRRTRRDRVRDERPERRSMECCGPRAHLYIDSRSDQIWVENSMSRHSQLDVTASLASAVTTPATPGMVQQGAADSKLDDSIMKAQGKVYRTDRYTVHWQAEGSCRPLQVSLFVKGEVAYQADCLPEQGEVTLSRTYLLVPPAYDPPGPGSLSAELEVTDCAGESAICGNTVPRP